MKSADLESWQIYFRRDSEKRLEGTKLVLEIVRACYLFEVPFYPPNPTNPPKYAKLNDRG